MTPTLSYVRDIILPAANYLLPDKMHSERADLLLLGIGFQESRFLYRKQIGGPARGLWEFELTGIQGVLQHMASREHILRVLKVLSYDFTPASSFEAIMHNDILAAVYARLLLWTDPRPIPAETDIEGLWNYYLNIWRPGKPRRATWDVSYHQALELANGRNDPGINV